MINTLVLALRSAYTHAWARILKVMSRIFFRSPLCGTFVMLQMYITFLYYLYGMVLAYNFRFGRSWVFGYMTSIVISIGISKLDR